MFYRIEQFIKQTHRSGITFYRIEQYIKQTYRSGIMFYRIEQFIKQKHRSGIVLQNRTVHKTDISLGNYVLQNRTVHKADIDRGLRTVHRTSNISKRQNVVEYLLHGLAEQDRCNPPRVSKLSVTRPTSANQNVTIKIPLEKRPPY